MPNGTFFNYGLQLALNRFWSAYGALRFNFQSLNIQPRFAVDVSLARNLVCML